MAATDYGLSAFNGQTGYPGWKRVWSMPPSGSNATSGTASAAFKHDSAHSLRISLPDVFTTGAQRPRRCLRRQCGMRIVGGEFGGRRLVVPKDTRVRPTSDRVREAWMSILGDHIVGARVLDLFAGSG